MQKVLRVIKSSATTYHHASERGFSLIEAVLASTIFAVLMTTLVSALIYGLQTTGLAGERARAAMYAEEGIAAVRNIRDAAYANLVDGTHGLAIASNEWIFSGVQDTNDIFTRQVTIAPVNANEKQVTSTVTWQQNEQRTGSISYTTYLSNWIAASVVIPSWATPILEASLDVANPRNGVKVAYAGNYAYLLRSGATSDLVVIDISNTVAPVVATTFAITGNAMNIAISGNYVYVTSDSNSTELQIIDISNPLIPTLAGVYNAPGNANATGVIVNGTTVYFTRSSSADNEFVILNAIVPAVPVLVGSLNLGADANEIYQSGNYAYVASASNTQELQVINITTPATPALAGSLDLAGNGNALTIAGYTDRVIIGRAAQGANPVLHIVNVATPATPALVSSYTTSGAVNDISLNSTPTYAFLATGNNASEFEVLDITAEATPVLFGSVNLTPNNLLSGIVYDSAKDRAYAAGTTNTQEFLIFKPN